jgi:hypothetical protein
MTLLAVIDFVTHIIFALLCLLSPHRLLLHLLASQPINTI